MITHTLIHGLLHLLLPATAEFAQVAAQVAEQVAVFTGPVWHTGLTWHTVATGTGAIGDVCAKAPVGVEPYVNEILGWVKYGVIAIIIGCGFASVGAMIIGKIGSMGRAAQVGASGLLWTVLGAIVFVVIYGVLNGIVGDGC